MSEKNWGDFFDSHCTLEILLHYHPARETDPVMLTDTVRLEICPVQSAHEEYATSLNSHSYHIRWKNTKLSLYPCCTLGAVNFVGVMHDVHAECMQL